MGRYPKRDEMSFMSFLGIVLRDSFHYRSRLIGSILGALIAVSFIAGAVISVDDISSKFFSTELEKRDYHYRAYRYDYYGNDQNIDIDVYAKKISDIEGIETVRGYAESSFYLYNGTNTWSAGLLAITNDTISFLFGDDVVLPSAAGDVIVPRSLASRIGLQQNDTFRMVLDYHGRPLYDKNGGGYIEYYPGSDKSINVTFHVFSIVDMVEDRYYGPYYDGNDILIMGIGGLRSFLGTIEPIDQDIGYHEVNQYMEIKISSSYLKNLDDAEKTRSEVRQLTRAIGTALADSQYDVEGNEVEDIYSSYQIWSWMMRIFFIVLSIPLLLISFYLLSAGSKVGMDERIREIGLLRIKGASRGQVITILMMESLIFGIIGGGLGLLAGSMLSAFFTAQVYGLEPFKDIFRGNLPVPGIPMIVFAFILIPILILIMRISATLKLSKVPLLEALGRANIVDKQKTYRITIDLLVLSFTLLIVGLMLYFNRYPPSDFYTALIYFLLLFFSPLTVLFLPFLLILTISRILILGFDLTLDLLSSIGKVLINELYPVVKANMHFQRRRIATLTILVTAVISFGILISSLDASRSDKVEKDVLASIPSEIMVVEGNGYRDHLDDISDLDSVTWAVKIQNHNGVDLQTTDGSNYGPKLYAFDSEEYTEHIDVPKRLLIEGHGPKELKGSNGIPVLINGAFNYDSGLTVGDSIEIGTDNRYVRLNIIGQVSYLPGMRSTINENVLIDQDPYLNLQETYEDEALYMDISYLPQNISSSYWTYLLDIEGDEGEAIKDINDIDWNGTNHIVLSRGEEIESMKEEPFFTSIQMLLDMEYLFVIAAVTGGVMLFMTVSTASRRKEFAELIARGSTRTHVLRLVLTEGSIVLIAGLVIGTLIGISIAYAFQHLFTFDLFQVLSRLFDDPSNGTQIDTGSGIVFPPEMLLLHLFAIISVLGASLLTSWLASKVDVASSLRLRTS